MDPTADLETGWKKETFIHRLNRGKFQVEYCTTENYTLIR